MAKNKGGLGRGLNSLLGNSMSDPNYQENQPNPIPILSDDIPPIEEAAPQASENTSVEEVEANETSAEQSEIIDDVEDLNEEIYEDNITIKEVTSRPASPSTQRPAPPSPVGLRDAAEVDIDRIMPNPDQPRISFKKDEIEELAESIRKNGLLQPILVRRMPEDTYQIIAGERRWQACQMLKMSKVPVRIKDVDDDETIILALVENVQRSDLNPIEEAYGYRRMMERGKMTQSEVAQAVSKGRSTIANALRLLELPEDAQQLLFEERITAGHARAILSVPTQEGRRKITDKLVESNLSVRETEALARQLSGKKEKKEAPKQQAPKSYRTIARALGDELEAAVKIKSVKGKNKIEIEFKDETDLERLFRKITAHR